jgi:hypothetical protein
MVPLRYRALLTRLLPSLADSTFFCITSKAKFEDLATLFMGTDRRTGKHGSSTSQYAPGNILETRAAKWMLARCSAASLQCLERLDDTYGQRYARSCNRVEAALSGLYSHKKWLNAHQSRTIRPQ